MEKTFGIKFMKTPTTVYVIQQQGDQGWEILEEAFVDEDSAGARVDELTAELMFEFLTDEEISEVYPEFEKFAQEVKATLKDDGDEPSQEVLDALLAGLKDLTAEDPHPLWAWSESQIEGGTYSYTAVRVMDLDLSN